MDDDEQQLADLGALRADDSEDYADEDPLDEDDAHDLDLELHDPVEDQAADPVPMPEQALVDRGRFALARSADGLEVMNTLEVLPPFELSI